MKKTVLFLFLSLCMMGCKKTPEVKKDLITVSPADCDILDSIPANGTQEENAKWLKANVKVFSDDFFECVSGYHKKDSADILKAVDVFWSRRTPQQSSNPNFKKYSELTVEKFKSLNTCSCYKTYLGFDIDTMTNTITFKPINDFVSKPSCYSFPMLMGIFNENKMIPTDTFDFARAIFGKEERIIIRVKDNNSTKTAAVYNYYDISDDPKFNGM